MTALTPSWGELKRIGVTYQKAKSCVINTSLAGWIAEGDKPKGSLWMQTDVQWSWKTNLSGELCFWMHEGSADKCERYGNLSWVACYCRQFCDMSCSLFWIFGTSEKLKAYDLDSHLFSCLRKNRIKKQSCDMYSVLNKSLLLPSSADMCAHNGNICMLEQVIRTH